MSSDRGAPTERRDNRAMERDGRLVFIAKAVRTFCYGSLGVFFPVSSDRSRTRRARARPRRHAHASRERTDDLCHSPAGRALRGARSAHGRGRADRRRGGAIPLHARAMDGGGRSHDRQSRGGHGRDRPLSLARASRRRARHPARAPHHGAELLQPRRATRAAALGAAAVGSLGGAPPILFGMFLVERRSRSCAIYACMRSEVSRPAATLGSRCTCRRGR